MYSAKRIILIFTEWYFPGYKAGGPIQSCWNLVAALNDDFEFYILTSSRDLGSVAIYPEVEINKWQTGKQGEKVYYADDGTMNGRFIRKTISDIQPDVIYLNSMFSYKFSILPILLLKLYSVKILTVLAPRGMLKRSALSIKQTKKAVFLKSFTFFQLHANLHFHATDREEANDIQKIFPHAVIEIAENIPNDKIGFIDGSNKRPGILKLIFYSRVHATKNLIYILDLFRNYEFKGEIFFDIYGDSESESYMLSCMKLSRGLASNIHVQFFPAEANVNILSKLPSYDLFVLPSLGESFGHAIFESMMSGVPVLISDQTPWRNLGIAKAGWDISLNEPDSYCHKLQEFVDMVPETHLLWRAGARKHAEHFLGKMKTKNKYLSLFNDNQAFSIQ